MKKPKRGFYACRCDGWVSYTISYYDGWDFQILIDDCFGRLYWANVLGLPFGGYDEIHYLGE